MNFSQKIVEWYGVNKRDLPWRNTSNPYYIWLSEIILQQTRVNQGLPYYLRFVEKFPDIQRLANADEDQVLKLWQGLGYYSRARNMHSTAKNIVSNYNSIFPREYKELLGFKGVGAYTAAAISSFAFNLPVAVVDGNVIRVLSRFFGVDIPFDINSGRKKFNELAEECLIKENSAIYNQAIMDFGAIQCKPKSPNCLICPIQDSCFAYHNNRINYLPFRANKVKKRIRYLHFFMIETSHGFCVRKRDSGIWNGLYEFPYIEFSEERSVSKVIQSNLWRKLFSQEEVKIKFISNNYIHHLSHQKIVSKFWFVNTQEFSNVIYQKVTLNTLRNLPVSRLMEKYLETL